MFDKLWEQVHIVFGLTAPRDTRKTLCKSKVLHIPDEAVKWIAEQFEYMDSKPRNIVLAIRRLWDQWQEQNPDRMVKQRHHCPYCIPGTPGKMLILRRQKGCGIWDEWVVPCGHCQEIGWRVDDPTHNDFWHHLKDGYCPASLQPLLGIGRTPEEVAFVEGAPFHELLRTIGETAK
jgi:hypothetical protein